MPNPPTPPNTPRRGVSRQAVISACPYLTLTIKLSHHKVIFRKKKTLFNFAPAERAGITDFGMYKLYELYELYELYKLYKLYELYEP